MTTHRRAAARAAPYTHDCLASERAMLLGWVTNNYWETNFRAHQPGAVQARYRLQPYAGAFDEARAHRFGLEAAHDRPLLEEPRSALPVDNGAIALDLAPREITVVQLVLRG